jgi:hypothetical protein
MWPSSTSRRAWNAASVSWGTERRREQKGHNHPSGDPSPSPEDVATTAGLMTAGKVLGIPVVDHVIVTREPGRWHSMATRGTLPRASFGAAREPRSDRGPFAAATFGEAARLGA